MVNASATFLFFPTLERSTSSLFFNSLLGSVKENQTITQTHNVVPSSSPPPSFLISSPSPPFMINYSVNIICRLNRNISVGRRNCVSLLMSVDTHLQQLLNTLLLFAVPLIHIYTKHVYVYIHTHMRAPRVQITIVIAAEQLKAGDGRSYGAPLSATWSVKLISTPC